MVKSLRAAALVAAFVSASPVVARPMTATDMQSMHRVGAPEISPDGKWAVFTISDTDFDANKRNNTLYLLDLTRPGATPQRVAGAEKGHDAVFGSDGALYFLMKSGDRDQLFRMPVGGASQQISDFGADVSGFKLSPAGDRVVVWADQKDCPDLACAATTFPAKPAGSGRTYDKLFVRHWDSWAEPGTRSRIYAFPIEGGKLTGGGVRLTGQLEGDTPSKPMGGGEEIAFAPDGKTVFFALREAGRIEPLSTNLDIFASPADGSTPPVNLTDANDGTDNLPAVSPDGRTLAYFAMARAGYEADRQVLQLRDLATGQTRALTQGWDRSVGSIEWARDGKSLLVTAEDTLEQPVFRVDALTGKVTRLTKDGHYGNVRALPNGGAVATMNSIMAPDDIYLLNRSGKTRQLTYANRELLAKLDPVTLKKFSFKGANNDVVWGWTLKPGGPQYAAAAKLPVLLLVHGGPQGTFANSWSFRWNPRVFTGPGYAAVSVDFHGSTGYGQAFTDAINKNWGGWPLEDLQKGLAFATANDAQLDVDKACAAGGSYGGYMMNWIEGRWPDRFKCLVQHDGVFDARAMAYETEELWFDEWEHGGKPYYEDPQAFEQWNPANYVTAWKTPQLVITSENDFRIPYTQGIAAFTALQRRDIPSRLLIFPDENHWVLKPKNSVQWYDEVFSWLGKYLNGPQ
ncbi:S9 family peptidase [Sphingomonas daechungensis]|uniref:S9 family peptidase n=1 Tax=Sphingomonas daechungensis TaxID=1176646 RepID=A0ABX6T2C2_9SPHN|nr:S9 family peptidase [Sphingomonas daechungensis]QNP43574.1 S9 family peptidase [Sphingomonas daechungensis]